MVADVHQMSTPGTQALEETGPVNSFKWSSAAFCIKIQDVPFSDRSKFYTKQHQHTGEVFFSGSSL